MTTWQERHLIERMTPKPGSMAQPVVALLSGLHLAVAAREGWQWPDSSTTPALGQVIEGIIDLLNEDIGALDSGSVWQEIEQIADVIGWDLDKSEIRWDR